MKVTWDEVNARAQGLSGRLLGRRELEVLAKNQDLRTLARELRNLGYPVTQSHEAPRPELLERAVREGAALRLRTLARWCGNRTAIAAVIFEDQERQNLRILLRGTIEGAAPEARLRGAIPTPALPEAWLQELARQESAAAVARLLTLRRNAYAEAIAAEVQTPRPDPLRVELAIARRFAERAAWGAGLARKTVLLKAYVAELVDLENVLTALLLVTEPVAGGGEDMFLSGGCRIGKELFLDALRCESPVRAASVLAGALRGTPFAGLIEQHCSDPNRLERAFLVQRIRQLRADALREPLQPARLLLYHLRLQVQVADLLSIIWAVPLEAPFETVVEELLTP
jgi:hypothetical protein